MYGDSNSVIAGNYLGVDVTGTHAVGSGDTGINVNGSTGIRIGTNGADVDADAERNVVAGNWRVDVQVGSSTNAEVAGNYIGLDASGTHLVGISSYGIYVYTSSGIQVGGNDATERNVVAPNGSGYGIAIDQNTNNSQVAGNYVGTDATGTASLGSGYAGIEVWGTSDEVQRNIVAGNWSVGVLVVSSANAGVAGNYVGVDVTGTQIVGATSTGIQIYSSSGVLVGTNGDGVDDAAERNVIVASNTGIDFSGAVNSDIAGNYLGVDATGTASTRDWGIRRNLCERLIEHPHWSRRRRCRSCC